MKHFSCAPGLFVALLLAMVSSAVAQQQAADRGANTSENRWAKVRPLPLESVRLTGGPLKAAQDADARFLLTIDPDRALSALRTAAGLEAKAEPLTGWDSAVGHQLTGHIAGHLLSAVSLMYAASGDARFKQRADYLVSELAAIQEKQGGGYLGAQHVNATPGREIFNQLSAGNVRVANAETLNGLWSPWYVQHKMFAGYQKPYQTGDDPRAWWLDRIHDLTFIPSYLTRDGMQYQYEVKTAPAAQGAPQNTITAVHSLQDSYAIPPYYGQTPEFACRPPMGIGRDDLETSLDLKPVGGPPGCVLLRQHRLIREEAPYQRPGTKSGDMLFWLDPARGNAVVRTDDMALDPDGKEFTEMSIAVEDLAQSPSGVWYAKKVRTTQTSLLNGQETKSDNLQNIYVDFDAKLPDELFAVPVVGASVPNGP